MSIKTFYNSSFFQSVAQGLITPFIPIFALSLGASKTLIGLLSSLPNLTNIFSQAFWGSLADITRKKKLMIILGGIFWALVWIPIAFVKDPISLIVLITIQAFLAAISAPAWTVEMIRTMPSYKRGRIAGDVNTISGIGSFFGTLIGGYILNNSGFIPFLFFMVCFFGALSRVPFLFIKLPSMPVYHVSLKSALKRTFNISRIRKEKKLMSFMKTIIFLHFAVSIAGPFLSVHIVQNLGGSSLDIAIISAIGALSAILFYGAWGMLVDYLGRKTVMLSCIIPISFIPFVYSVSGQVFWLYLYSIVSSISWAGFNLAAFAYLSDAIPFERSSSYVSIYHLFTGLSSAISPFIGGIIADLTSIYFIFMLSTILRISTIYFIDRLEEKTGLRPRGIFNFRFDYFGIAYRLETFVLIYSLAIYEARKRGKRIMNLGKYLKSFERNMKDNMKKIRKRKLRSKK